MAHDASAPRRFVKIAILTVSDTRSLETDTSGSFLQQALEEEGHQLADRKLVIDDIYQMRAVVSTWIADPEVEVIITTGGTGFTGRDSTPEALSPLFDKHIELLKRLIVEQNFQALPRRQLSLGMLGFYAAFAAAQPCTSATNFQLLQNILHNYSLIALREHFQ